MTSLARYDAMCRAIDAAYAVDEVKDIRDKAKALEQYNRQAQNVEAERQACEIRLRAERKAGKLLGEMENAKTGPKKLGNTTEPNSPLPLEDLGISKKQSSDWQKLAGIPQRDFERSLKQTDHPTTAGLIREHHTEPRAKQNPVAPEALWLWGRLNDFERDGLLARDPADVLETMVDHMKDSVHRLAPKVAAWLKQIGAAK